MMMKYKALTLILISMSLLFCTSCDNKHYVGQHFYFPQNSDPDKSDWKFHGYVHMSLVGNWFDLNEKDIKISIFNDQGKELTLDTLSITARGLRVDTIWEGEILNINFIETEDPFKDGIYKSNSDLHSGVPIRKLIYSPRKLFEK